MNRFTEKEIELMKSIGLDCDFQNLDEDDDYWMDIEDAVADALMYQGFDENYEPNDYGLSLIHIFMYKLNDALKNAPRERKAQAIANSVVEAKKKANPDMSKAEIKKASQQALTSARASVGAKRTPVQITDKEWEAIQAGAISENKLLQILNNTDIDEVRKRATPRTTNVLSQAKINRCLLYTSMGWSYGSGRGEAVVVIERRNNDAS